VLVLALIHEGPYATAAARLTLAGTELTPWAVNERDPFNVFVVHTPESIGGFAEETQWKGQIERFRFDMDGTTIHAVFPWTDTHEDIKVDARPCHEQGMDYCLELSGSSHGVSRYYSRTGWERKSGEDIEAFKTRAFAR
jgi:hypothetical protein